MAMEKRKTKTSSAVKQRYNQKMYNKMDKIVHGLDLPDDISERNNEVVMKELGITEEDILNAVDEIEIN